MAGHGASEAKLVPMANQIAAFFHAFPEAEALGGITRHIADFWTPGMRRALHAMVAAGCAELDPLVVRAFEGEADGSPAHGDGATIDTGM